MGQHAFTEPINADAVVAAKALDSKGATLDLAEVDGEVPEGFQPLGTIAPGELVVLPDVDDDALRPWGGEQVRTLQAHQQMTFPLTPLLPWQAAVFEALFGKMTPAEPTPREALVDLWDALRALVLVVAVAVRERVEDVYDAVLDGVEGAWYSLRDHVTDRWYVLTIWQYRRKLVGPLVRFWDADYTHLATMPRRRETWREWAVRQAQLPRRVWRG
ncbi:hypothetical protein I5G81_gp86 [Mycobacterium phage Shandong1]|uniref:Uncharacterized protein n=1 Tax=Mycobacterium phage Shandong1 TaxID=1983447 RepID=A0A1X9SHB1_9CAUD|nr:hypothetical protein I5G81_gp86 [Mycobacterium phage Shandong1]ARQ95525.1 hypothetical protein [Mycobacterium phage Shandong1]